MGTMAINSNLSCESCNCINCNETNCEHFCYSRGELEQTQEDLYYLVRCSTQGKVRNFVQDLMTGELL